MYLRLGNSCECRQVGLAGTEGRRPRRSAGEGCLSTRIRRQIPVHDKQELPADGAKQLEFPHLSDLAFPPTTVNRSPGSGPVKIRQHDFALAIFDDAAHIASMAGKDVPSIGKMQQLVADAKAELEARGIDTSKMMPADFLRAARDARIKSDTDERARRFPAKSEPK